MANQDSQVTLDTLAGYHDALMQDVIEPLTGPTYDSTNESINFPITAKVAYDSEHESIDFG